MPVGFIMTARKAQFRVLVQAIDTDADGFISKEEYRVLLEGCSGERSDEEVAREWGYMLENFDTNHDGKVRWPLRGHAALAESRCGVPSSAWKSMWIARPTTWKA